MGTPLTPEEQEAYAPPASVMRKMIESGLIEYPTREEKAYEDLAVDLLNGKWVTIPVGTSGTGRRLVLELGSYSDGAMTSRLTWTEPVMPDAPEDTMGAPDFPLTLTPEPLPNPWAESSPESETGVV